MKSRLIGTIIKEHCLLIKAEICPNYLNSKLSLTRKFYSNYSQLNRLLSVNYFDKNKLFTQRNFSKWTPNIVKSPYKDCPIPEGSFIDHVWANMDQWADRVALVCGVTGREIKYLELRELSKRIATMLLSDLGISPGQVVAFILPNILEYPPLILGALEAGIIITPMNPLYVEDELSFQLKNSGAVAAVTLPEKLDILMRAVPKVENQKDIKIIVTPNTDGTAPKELPDGVLSYLDLLANRTDISLLDSIKPKTVSPDDVIMIPYSSGTTGLPKGVCLTQKNLISNNIFLKFINICSRTTSTFQEVVPIVLPIFHVYGLSVNLTKVLSLGGKLILLPKFEEKTFLKVLKDYQATLLMLAPPLVMYLANSCAVTEEHLASVKKIMCGAAPLTEMDILKCMKKLPKDALFVQGYGLSETSPSICAPKVDTKLPNYNTVGQVVPNTMVKVIDLQTSQALSANEDGEICVKGPQVMKGYLNNPEATAESIDSEGWFHTGDIGYYDKDGFFYITDRLKELIKVKGFQVAPSELEKLLRSHPDVTDAGVIGVPHDKFGEVPVAFLQTDSKDKKHLEIQLKKFVSDRLAKYKRIEKYYFVDELPKSAAGKLLKKDLKVMYQNMNKL